MKNLLLLISSVLFFSSAQSQVYTVKYDTMQHFEYDSDEDPVKVIEEGRVTLTKYSVDKLTAQIDLTNKTLKVTGGVDGDFIRKIKKILYNHRGNLLIEYSPKLKTTVYVHLLITDAIVGKTNKKIIMYWYFDGKKTYGEFGFLD